MVAPHNVGEPIRSLVRVPGEGRSSTALCWDLSRASSLVAAGAPLQLPPTAMPLPPVAPVTRALAASSTLDLKKAPDAPSPSPPLTNSKQQPPPPVARQGAARTASGVKRLREEEERQGCGSDAHKAKLARVTEDSGVQQPVNIPVQPQPGPEKELQQLRQQCRMLKQHNEELQQRLNQIYSLLKDKERRSSLVRRLDMLVK